MTTAQERAILQPDGFPGGEMLIKTSIGSTTTSTPHVEFSPELIKMLANIANMVKSEIYLVRRHALSAVILADGE
jgi:hypothetical protein